MTIPLRKQSFGKLLLIMTGIAEKSILSFFDDKLLLVMARITDISIHSFFNGKEFLQ